MFCPLVKIEIKKDTCGVLCIYKGVGNKCFHKELTADDIAAERIAEIKGMKPYVVKDKITSSKHRIRLGLLISSYIEYIVDNKFQVVNKHEDTTYESVLVDILELPKEFYSAFLNESIFAKWKARQKIEIDLSDFLQILFTLKKETPNEH